MLMNKFNLEIRNIVSDIKKNENILKEMLKEYGSINKRRKIRRSTRYCKKSSRRWRTNNRCQYG